MIHRKIDIDIYQPLPFNKKKEIYTGWYKKSLWCDLEEKCLRNSKIFLWNSKIFFYGVFLSHIFSGSKSFLSYVEKKLWGFTRKIFLYKEVFFLFYVAKSISFEVISVLKISTFAAKLIIFWLLLQSYLRNLKF